MVIKTTRFGELKLEPTEIISIPSGLLGFPEQKEFCLVDPGDQTLILWLQSIREPALSFPVLEPKVFQGDYAFSLTFHELRELKLKKVSDATVLCILTIPTEITEMSANLKAPLVINIQSQIAKQVVLQENKFQIKHPMFKELRAHLLTIASNTSAPEEREVCPVVVQELLPYPRITQPEELIELQ